MQRRWDAYLVSTDERGLCGDGPIALGGVEIGVADTGHVELDETLAGLEVLRLDDGVVCADFEGGTVCWDDGGGLGLWDGELRRHCWARAVFVNRVQMEVGG